MQTTALNAIASKSLSQQRGEINLNQVGMIVAIVLAITSFLYAQNSSQQIKAQQETITKLQAEVASQQDLISKASSDASEVQASVNGLATRVDSIEKSLAAAREEAKKRAEAAAKAKTAAKPAAKPAAHSAKPAAKTTKKTTHH